MCRNMPSLNKIIYILGTKKIPLSIRDISTEIKEDADRKTLYDRVRSFIVKFSSMFIKSGKKREYKYTLSSVGKLRFEKIENIYDFETDTLLE